ncbi:hypothetical protein COCNU_02G013600 [Cocos nucifera]|uniref:Uncharacterized protein n=1 Tax=Cocos nucifera TaxID=13894 RepID=A0A8K0I0Q7_COCNU|nr:hypothetical protein COCNU_02G013600 [Cocos nucifera]
MNVVGMLGRANSRVNAWHNMLISMQKRTKALIAKGEGGPPIEPFPSLIIDVDGIQAKGSYAEAQARSGIGATIECNLLHLCLGDMT